MKTHFNTKRFFERYRVALSMDFFENNDTDLSMNIKLMMFF